MLDSYAGFVIFRLLSLNSNFFNTFLPCKEIKISKTMLPRQRMRTIQANQMGSSATSLPVTVRNVIEPIEFPI